MSETSPAPQPVLDPSDLPAVYDVPERSFWRQGWVHAYLPVLMSVALHSAVVLTGAVLFATGAVDFIAEQVRSEPLVITDSAVIDDSGEVGGLVNPGLNDDLVNPAAQLQDEDVSASDSFTDERNDELVESLVTAGGSDTSASVIGAGDVTRGAAAGPGSAFGGGGKLAPFGRPGGGGGLGPAASVFGNTSNLRSLVFVCDASGSMIRGRDTALKAELNKSLAELKGRQFFNILFFSESEPQAFSRQTLVPGKPSAKSDANRFIERIEFSGSTNPIPALETAFSQRPELIWLLTDGAFADGQKVIDAIEALNGDRAVRVNTMLFLNTDDAAARDLRTIAENNGGTFRMVTQADLKRGP